MRRISTTEGNLARLGFGDPHRAAAILDGWYDELGENCDHLVAEILASADPDLAINGLDRLVGERPGLLADLGTNIGAWTRRLISVLGASVALNQHLGVHPLDADVLRAPSGRRDAAELRRILLDAVGAEPAAGSPVADPARSDDLRRAYRRELLRIAAADLTADDPLELLPEVAAELADLADATVETALALARGEVPGWECARLGIVALGKTGGQELNYLSDVDVLYIAEAALDESGEPVCDTARAVTTATKLVGAMSRICSAHTAAGTIWQIDAALRPEGKAGPLVRTLSSHATYYQKWAKNWEFQAMLKARGMAGDLALAQDFVDLVAPMVWHVAENDQFVTETQAMRRRVISLLPPREADREIKLGAGGLRDVEFSVQLIQLVHGRADDRVRQRGTLAALARLIEFGYVGRGDGKDLDAAYRLMRLLEHRIQLEKLRRTHLMPEDELSLRRLARGVGMADADELRSRWRGATRRVLGLHQRLFYSPLLEAVARIPSEAVRLTSFGAEVRLRALGYADPKAALRHIEALSQGLSRQAEIQRQLLPAMLGWFSAGPNPDHALLAFRQVSEAMGRTPWYLRALRDGDAMAERLARILSSSRYTVELMMRAPQSVGMLIDESSLRARDRGEILAEMRASAKRHAELDVAVQHIRAVRRRELLRLAMADLLGLIDLATVGAGLSELFSATIDASLEVVRRRFEWSPRIAVIALGRWGGHELSYASDADAMFVIEDTDRPDAVKIATQVVSELRSALSKAGPDPALDIDVDLRPEGKGGPMVRSLSSFIAYYERWSSIWEAQALQRAAHGAGDAELSEALLRAIDAVRYPSGGLARQQVHEIRKLKARMEVERIPRGSDPLRNTKLGPGGLSDVEWAVQLLQLQHGDRLPELRTTSTLDGLAAAEAADLISPEDAAALRDAWTMASGIRNAIVLLRGRASDTIPNDPREASAVAQLLGYDKGESSVFLDEYRRRTRRARLVMDHIFWGLE
ncbi:MAG: bifunctional [glutamine synthetase] adenylyltransferase/[glutamine synthetase]-adenylyl-L-tyrosine phosphorylase [Micropruina sp.]|uniref:bifunctional [glutamine synthetase] adenylyltransferase/[glutamine synthetase]-adenylyl-L-tyrosine phosphorylase n=1 Tax=Micropruina sp. TaxID=2737536 RepID=UPI0039E4AD65